jgi:hypothetical protein
MAIPGAVPTRLDATKVTPQPSVELSLQVEELNERYRFVLYAFIQLHSTTACKAPPVTAVVHVIVVPVVISGAPYPPLYGAGEHETGKVDVAVPVTVRE